MMKSTISIVAFTLTFGFSVVLVGLLFGFPQPGFDDSQNAQSKCFDQQRYEIERFIGQDIRNGELRNSKISGFHFKPNDTQALSKYAETVENYIELSDSMNDSDLPQDFQYAWRRHMSAWKNYSAFLYEQTNPRFPMAEDRKIEHERTLNLEIAKTWKETLRIGQSHGARF